MTGEKEENKKIIPKRSKSTFADASNKSATKWNNLSVCVCVCGQKTLVFGDWKTTTQQSFVEEYCMMFVPQIISTAAVPLEFKLIFFPLLLLRPLLTMVSIRLWNIWWAMLKKYTINKEQAPGQKWLVCVAYKLWRNVVNFFSTLWREKIKYNGC